MKGYKNEQKNKGKIKKQQGITLVALAVTIIIMLILAGVTIGTLLGKNGLLSKTKKAVEYYEKVQEEEKIEMDKMYTKLASLGETNGVTEAEMRKIVNEIAYPVGSIYMSMNETDPGTIVGGNWEKIEGRFLLGASEKYEVGTEGGEETHSLTVNEMPKHNHAFGKSVLTWPRVGNDTPAWKEWGSNNGTAIDVINSTANAGGSQPHNNMPPYLVVYMWKRVS